MLFLSLTLLCFSARTHMCDRYYMIQLYNICKLKRWNYNYIPIDTLLLIMTSIIWKILLNVGTNIIKVFKHYGVQLTAIIKQILTHYTTLKFQNSDNKNNIRKTYYFIVRNKSSLHFCLHFPIRVCRNFIVVQSFNGLLAKLVVLVLGSE